MFEFIAEILMWFPSDAEIGTMRVWLTDYISTHIIVSSALALVVGYIVKKTKTQWDDKAWAWIKGKLGFGVKVDA